MILQYSKINNMEGGLGHADGMHSQNIQNRCFGGDVHEKVKISTHPMS